MSDESHMVDVTLRIDQRNLDSLQDGKTPAAYIWLEDNGDGTFALCAAGPLGFEASRNLPNHHPESRVARMSEDQRLELAQRWEREGGVDRWGVAISEALRTLREQDDARS